MMNSAPKSGIFAVLNIETKTVQILASSNVLLALVRYLQEHQRRGDNIDSWQVEFLEYNDDESLLVYHANKYKAMGYKLSNYYTPITWNVVKRVQLLDGVARAFVLLRSSGNTYRVMGVFEHMTEAEEFIETYFAGKELILEVMATNSLSRDYFRKN